MSRKMTVEQKILTALVDQRIVLKEELIQAIYGDDPDGGPLAAETVLSVRLCWLRRALKEQGWGIETIRGYRYGGAPCATTSDQTGDGLPSISGAIEENLSPEQRLMRLLEPGESTWGRHRIRQGSTRSSSSVRRECPSNPSQRIAS